MTPSEVKAMYDDLSSRRDALGSNDLVMLNLLGGPAVAGMNGEQTKNEVNKALQNIGRQQLDRCARILAGETLNPTIEYYMNFDGAIFRGSISLVDKDMNRFTAKHAPKQEEAVNAK